MAVAFRSAGALATATGSVNIAYPSGLAAGDLLTIHDVHGAGTLTVPSGWTRLIGPVTGSDGGGGSLEILYKIASGSESGTLTVGFSAGTPSHAGIMAAFSGADTTTPIDASGSADMAGSGTSAAAPSVTTTQANTLVLHFFTAWAGTITMTPPGGETERYDTFFSALGYLFGMSTVAQAAAGASGTATATTSGSMFGGRGATVAVAPSSGPPPSTFVPQIVML